METQSWVNSAMDYLLQNHSETLGSIVLSDDEISWRPVPIDFVAFLDHDPRLANRLLVSFRSTEKNVLKPAARRAQEHVIASREANASQFVAATVKERLVFHVHSLPVNPEITSDTIPRSEQSDHLFAMRGTAIRVSAPRTVEWEVSFRCSRCGAVVHCDADLSRGSFHARPPCPSGRCGDRNMALVGSATASTCRDYQEIRLQERLQSTCGRRAIPESSLVILLDGLAGSVEAGDQILVSGVVVRRWRGAGPRIGERPAIESILLAHHVSHLSARSLDLDPTACRSRFEAFWDCHRRAGRPLAARDAIVRSISPSLAGGSTIKLAAAIVLAGGVRRVGPSGSAVRGEAHMLVAGSPGTGKSRLLRDLAAIASRAVLATGSGTTVAGLTAAAIRDPSGDWTLEAGALVLADGGVCCIDEFGAIPSDDQAAVHEAMEQQALHIAKAGLVCSLRTRCSVIAAITTGGGGGSRRTTDKFAQSDLSESTGLASPLLSRFDVALMLEDLPPDPAWDRCVAKHVLENGAGGGNTTGWSLSLLRAYFQYIRANFSPEVSPEAQLVLRAYYRRRRAIRGTDAAQSTVRLLESLIRLAQGHARLMAHNQATRQDAVFAVVCAEATAGIQNQTQILRSVQPDDPDASYPEFERGVLGDLGVL